MIPGSSPPIRPARIAISQIMQDLRYRFDRWVLGRSPVWPLMKPREVEIIMDLLRRLRPRRVLEWGSGYGTLYFTRRYSEFEAWLSIEHSEEWAGKIRHLNTDPRVEIVSVEAREGFSEYVDYPSNRGTFDLADRRPREDRLSCQGARLSQRTGMPDPPRCRTRSVPSPPLVLQGQLFLRGLQGRRGTVGSQPGAGHLGVDRPASPSLRVEALPQIRPADQLALWPRGLLEMARSALMSPRIPPRREELSRMNMPPAPARST